MALPQVSHEQAELMLGPRNAAQAEAINSVLGVPAISPLCTAATRTAFWVEGCAGFTFVLRVWDEGFGSGCCLGFSFRVVR